uniref:Uncharacterized protein n=1 Tax=Oryza brachyantha TaxID=4533 RepID=J3MGX7_ORYBR
MLTLATRARVQRPFASNPLLLAAKLSCSWPGNTVSEANMSSGKLDGEVALPSCSLLWRRFILSRSVDCCGSATSLTFNFVQKLLIESSKYRATSTIGM